MQGKNRLDLRLVELGLVGSRQKAQALILAANVLVDGQIQTKPDFSTTAGHVISLRAKEKFVSRGGHKLEGALEAFELNPSGKDALDIGASTGGFTDCLLQHGALSVTAVDVGYGQLSLRLREDSRVRVLERTNARYLNPKDFLKTFHLATLDVSFISLEKVLPAVLPLVRPAGEILALIKPQFEAGPAQVKKGVVRDSDVHDAVVEKIRAYLKARGLTVLGVVPSVLKGPKGNTEFFLYAKKPSD